MSSISVIIPAYNRRHTLARSLESVLRQTRAPEEIIVVDDGSTDGTGDFVRSVFPSIKYLFQENRGPASARNTGIRSAAGEWIAFLDSDDEWTPEKLSVQEDYFRRNPDIRIAQTEEIWIRNGKRVNPMKKHRKYGGRIFDRCLPLCIVSPSAVMLRRTLLDETGLFDETYPACEDYELWLRIAARHEIGLIEKACVIKYGGHEDQRSREFPAMDRFRIRAIAGILETGILDAVQREQALRELEEKARIYIAGAEKRGKSEDIAEYKNILDRARSSGPKASVS